MFSLVFIVLIIHGCVNATPNEKTTKDEITDMEEAILQIKERLSTHLSSTHAAISDKLLEAGKIFSQISQEYYTGSSDVYIIYQEKIYNLEVNITDNEILDCIREGKTKLSLTLTAQMQHMEEFLNKIYYTIDSLEKALRPNVDETWTLYSDIYIAFKSCNNMDCYKEQYNRALSLEKDLDSGLLSIKPKIFLNLNGLDYGLKEFTLTRLETFFFELQEVYKEVQKCRVKFL